jgi:DNA polymerase/3'-5' exonuclease PolX
MSDHPKIPLAEAERIAKDILAWLAPVVERAEIAGSIRRRKPEVSDIEIVCVPKIEETVLDLFGQATDTRNMVDELATDGLCDSSTHNGGRLLDVRLDKNRRQALGSRYKRLMWIIDQDPGEVALDLFSVFRPAAWGVIMAIRTGPAEFSQRLVTQRSKGGLLPDHMSVKDGDLMIDPNVSAMEHRAWMLLRDQVEERDFFEAIGLDWIEPEARV